MTNLKIGDKAPDFSALNENGESLSLSDFAGRRLILFFYPKDNTPTCTVESCNLRDSYNKLKSKGFEVLGISPDSARKHQNFIKKFELPYSLLVDSELKMIKDYGVWGWKKSFGKEYEGLLRTTFVVDEEGIIMQVITKVEAKRHTDQILEGLN